jgi:hypothetical protein
MTANAPYLHLLGLKGALAPHHASGMWYLGKERLPPHCDVRGKSETVGSQDPRGAIWGLNAGRKMKMKFWVIHSWDDQPPALEAPADWEHELTDGSLFVISPSDANR